MASLLANWFVSPAAPSRLSAFPPPATAAFGIVPFRKCRLSSKGVRAMAAEGGDRDGTAVLWFKQDLRVDDHPGLVAAASRHRNVVPLYVFDPRILCGYSDEMLEVLISALEELRKSLKDQGSDLLIGFGGVEEVILKLVNEVKATHIFAEEEVEYNLRRMISVVEAYVSASPFSWGSPEFVFWRTPFYDIDESLKELPASYNDFQKLQSRVTEPLSASALPVLEIELDRGAIPTYDDLKTYLLENTHNSAKNWASLASLSAIDVIRRKHTNQAKMLGGDSPLGISNQDPFPSSGFYERTVKNSVFVSRKANVIGGGTNVALNALAAYLRYLEGTPRDDWQEVHDKLRLTENRSGASFGFLFGCILHLGILSRRRVHYEAIKYEKERNAGFLSPFGYSVFTVSAAVDAVRSTEWFVLLNLKSLTSNETRYPIRIWRWKGHLIQYTVAGYEGPAVLLVHGFGAFLDHYRDNISPIADGGHRVWALTLLGFGKSEKPNIVYTELKWAELVRDFIADVVGESVHIAGNSIGGYVTAVVACLWPGIVKSVILMNTAGSIIPGYLSVQLPKGEPTSEIAWLGARLLLLYLQLRIRQLTKDCYPSNTERVDDWLINEMRRASYDPGAQIVVESVFNFKLPIPLNYLLESFGGKVLIIQGTKDPLSKFESRLSMFREHCSGVTIKELDAGHCPHDEMPEVVNPIIGQWVATVESSLCPVESI